jgi:hypothetical protein
MSIPFTQFMRPDGRQVPVTIDRPKEIEDTAKRLIAAGYRLEIEHLMTNAVSMEVIRPSGEDSLAMEICANGAQVPMAVDKMILDAQAELNRRKSEKTVCE